MAKRKGTKDPKPPLPTYLQWTASIPQVRKHFTAEIKTLIDAVPGELWEEPDICGLMYDFLPWHEYSTLAIQLRSDDPYDFGGWKHYECVDPDGRELAEEFKIYKQANHGLAYHRLLIEAAEALLTIDFSKLVQCESVQDGYLNPLFRLQVYHADQKFKFNYCEYVLARRLEQN